jgi:hypothetical protein
MEEELNSRLRIPLNQKAEPDAAQYWIVFLQPLPEAGERIAIALVFRDLRKRAWVRFDSRFSKALKLYPDLDERALNFCLENLQRNLNACDEVEAALNSYGPQITGANSRRIASPIAQHVVEMLLARYIYPSKEQPVRSASREENPTREHCPAPFREFPYRLEAVGEDSLPVRSFDEEPHTSEGRASAMRKEFEAALCKLLADSGASGQEREEASLQGIGASVALSGNATHSGTVERMFPPSGNNSPMMSFLTQQPIGALLSNRRSGG